MAESTWRPTRETIRESNLGRLMRDLGFDDYRDLHRWSVRDRAGFWKEAIRRAGIVWQRAPSAMLGLDSAPERPDWAPGGRLNIVDSCLRGPAERAAILLGREGDDRIHRTTIGELDRTSEHFAAGLRRSGCRPGDAVALYMPMTVECVAAYLGVVRAGCRVVSVADSFSAAALRQRLDIVETRLILTVDRFRRGGRTIDLFGKVKEAAAPAAVVVPSAEGGPEALRDEDTAWDAFLDPGGRLPVRPADPTDTINVLFSSGTTGEPKAIPWTHLTAIKCAVDGALHLDIRHGDVVAWPTSIGWMMGPWLIFAALINGATIALFEGAPGGREFVRFAEHAGVTVLGLVPSLVRAWRAMEPPWPADWSSIRLYGSTGEPSDPADYAWLMGRSEGRAPVIEYCGGTEIGGAYLTGTVVEPAEPSVFTTPALGLDLALLDEEGRPVGEGQEGEAFLVPPSIGLSETLLNHDHHRVYYEGLPASPDGRPLRRHGDRLLRLANGRYRAAGRADDTMNLGGIKVGSLEIERVLAGHPRVRECAAIGIAPAGERIERLVVYVVAAGAEDGLKGELDAMLRERLNPLFRIHELVAVDALPYTPSHKLMRRRLKTAHRQEGRDGETA